MSEMLIAANSQAPPAPSINGQLQERNRNLCDICYVRQKVKGYRFSDCDHSGSCRKCAQDYLKRCMKQKKLPKCFLDPDCGADMVVIGAKCFFQTFSQGTKKAWQKYSTNPEEFVMPDKECEVLDCDGIVSGGRCQKCLQPYCQICQKPSHSILQHCKKPNKFNIQGQKQCLNCRVPYIRVQGCVHITCPQCKYQFCELCQKKWDIGHKICIIRPESIDTTNIRETNNTISPALVKKPSGMRCCGLECAIF